MTESDATPIKLDLVKEKPAFAPFLPRAGAFLIDCVILYFAARILDQALRPVLLQLNPALPWLGQAAAFLYFFLAEGPLGKGRTPGKAILNLRVVGRDGEPLGTAAAFCRALLRQPVFLMAYSFFTPMDYSLAFPPSVQIWVMFVLNVGSSVAFTLMAAEAMGLAFHPYRRCWHDLWAGSYVTYDPAPPAFAQTLADPPDVIVERKLIHYPRMMLLFWALATVAVLIGPAKTLFDSKFHEAIKQSNAFRPKEDAAPYRIELSYPLEMNFKMAGDYVHWAANQYDWVPAMNSAGPSTPTLTAINRHILHPVMVRRTGAFAAQDLESPSLRAAAEAIRRQSWEMLQGEKAKENGVPETFQPRAFTLLLIEPFQILFHNGPVLRAIAYGPADPQAGELRFEPFVAPPPAADGATTATQPAAATADDVTTH